MTTDSQRCREAVRPRPTWWTSNWTPTRWQCTVGPAAGPPTARRAIARPPTTAHRWNRRHRLHPSQGRARLELAVERTRRIRYAACVATRRSGSISTPFHASPAKLSSDETLPRDLSVSIFCITLPCSFQAGSSRIRRVQQQSP